jgi:ribonuclease P protein component
MLPKQFRLKINGSKRFIWYDKRQEYTPLFKMSYHFKNKVDQPKIGFIVSGRVGKAVERNRFRRLLSEAVQARLAKFPRGIEVLIVANKITREVNYEEVGTLFDKVLSKVRLSSG